MKNVISETGESNSMNENDYTNDLTGSDLDIPDLEIDNTLEKGDIEDEENNYFSLGGDDHIDLEEDQARLPQKCQWGGQGE